MIRLDCGPTLLDLLSWASDCARSIKLLRIMGCC